MNKKAVVLLSGGLDSYTCLAIAQSRGFDCIALSFSYNQRHSAELEAAARVAKQLKAMEHRVVNLDLGHYVSALTDKNIEIPDYQNSIEIPVTYVPARNTIFLSIALGVAEAAGARDIFIGASSVDYSHYPDCREEYLAAFENMANLATKAGVEGDGFRIHAPLQHLSKADTILTGLRLDLDYSLTVSCYQANIQGQACGSCDSCSFRKKGFAQAGVADPTVYYSQ